MAFYTEVRRRRGRLDEGIAGVRNPARGAQNCHDFPSKRRGGAKRRSRGAHCVGFPGSLPPGRSRRVVRPRCRATQGGRDLPSLPFDVSDLEALRAIADQITGDVEFA